MLPIAPEHYKEILLFLVTAGLIVPLFRRLRISPVIGFLCAGAALGPHGLGSLASRVKALSLVTLADVRGIEPIAEFGVVFLLFTIGLELSFERLTRLRRLVFGLGALQLFTCAVALAGLALLLGQAAGAALVLGAGLALSSTAVIIPVMVERGRLRTNAGRTVFSVLLFQDLMVAPLLFLVTMLSIRTGEFWVVIAATAAPAVCGLLLVVGGGRLLIRPLFHHVAAAGSTEIFMAACLLVVVGTAALTALSGLSMGLGAFIAGLLLAETEFRREIEVTIEPFKGLLLGLFFVAVGAGLDFTRVVERPLATIGLAAGLILLKLALTLAGARAMRLPWRVATEAALMLAPGGEFAFVLVKAAIAGHLVAPALGADVEIAVTLSLFLVPGLAALSGRLTPKLPSVNAHLAAMPPPSPDAKPRALLVGYGRVGQLVASMLRRHRIPFLAVDEDVAVVRAHRPRGTDIVWGSAGRLDFLERCGLATASALIITLDDADVAEDIVRQVRARRPDLTIVARARDAERAARLYKLGASDAVPETIEASLQLSEAVLVDMGVPMGTVIASIHEKRDEFRRILQPVAGRAEERRAQRMSLKVKDMHRRAEAQRRKAPEASDVKPADAKLADPKLADPKPADAATAMPTPAEAALDGRLGTPVEG